MTNKGGRGVAAEGLGPTVTIGEILVEIMAGTIGNGFLEPQPLVGPFPSGAPAIFIDQVARLGGSAGMIGSVGADDFGMLNVERLRRDGVDVSGISVIADKPTGSAFVRYRPDGSRDFVYNIATSAAGDLRLTTEAEALLARAGHLHLMGSAFAVPGMQAIITKAVDIIRGRGGSVSFDPNMRKELVGDGSTGEFISRVLGVTDLLLPSGEELQVTAGLDDEASALEALHALGVPEIVVKRGKAGASYHTALDRIDAPGLAVEEIDPTGAGDCFGAAYLTCRRKGFDPARSLELANAAGARNVTRQGPMEGAGTMDELEAFIREHLKGGAA